MMIEKETKMIPLEQMSRKEQPAVQYWDMYKSMHGVRPRWMNYDTMAELEFDREFEFLSNESKVRITSRKGSPKAEAIARF
jgi:hypothetical protein